MADSEDIGTLLAKISLDVSELKAGLTQGKEEMGSFARQAKTEAEEVATGFKGAMLQVQTSVKEGFAKVQGIAAEGVEGVHRSIIGFGSAFAAALGLSLLKESADEVVNWAKEINRASQLLGTSTEEASKWKFALGQLSAENLGQEYSLQQLEMAFQRFLMRAMNSPDKLKELGISLQSLNDPTKSFTDKWFELAEAVQKIDDPTKQAALAVEMFGRNGMTLLPLLRMTREQFTEWGSEAAKMGLVLDDQTKGTLQRYTIAVHDLEETWLSVKLKILPVVNEIVLGIEKDFSNLIVTLKADAGIIKEIFSGIGAAALSAYTFDFSGAAQAVSNALKNANDIRNKANAEIDKNTADYNRKLTAPPVGGTQKTGGAAPFNIGDKLGGKGSSAGTEEDLWGEYYRMMDEKRRFELVQSQASIEIAKAEGDKKKAALELQLQEGEIDGQTYYTKLKEMQSAETANALKLIDQKKEATKAAYQAGLDYINQQAEKGQLSPQMKEYKEYEEQLKYKQEMAKLDAEAAKARLEGEAKVTEELKKQAAEKTKYGEEEQKYRIDTQELLGQITSQEATLQKLYLDWVNAKKAALAIPGFGGTAAYQSWAAAGDAYTAAKATDTQYGGYSTAITDFFKSLSDDLGKGMDELKKSANSLFKNLFNEAMKDDLTQLKNKLTSAFKDLFGEAGSAISSAFMGVIGLIGMLATAATSSSWSSSGAKSGTTVHESTRGVISGDSSIDVEKLSNYFQTALDAEVVPILSQIEINTRGGGKGSGSGSSATGTTVTFIGMTYDLFKEYMDKYFQNYLMKGANA